MVDKGDFARLLQCKSLEYSLVMKLDPIWFAGFRSKWLHTELADMLTFLCSLGFSKKKIELL